MTHELRTTIFKNAMVPVTRFNDGKMIAHIMNNWGKIDANMYVYRIFKQTNLYMKWWRTFEAAEIKLKFPDKRKLWVDGELFKVEEANVKLLPSHANFIGSVIEYTENEMKIKRDLDIL